MGEATVWDVYSGPLHAKLESGSQADSLRAVLDAQRPKALQSALKAGAKQAIRENPWISEGTQQKINRSVERSCALIGNLTPQWEQLDNYDRNGTWEALAAGAFSEETGIGAAIGTALLPGIGTLVGSMIGGMIAGNKIDEAANQAMEQFDTLFQQFYGTYVDDFNDMIVPALERDIESAQEQGLLVDSDGGWLEMALGFLVLVGGVVVIGGLGYGLYRLIF